MNPRREKVYKCFPLIEEEEDEDRWDDKHDDEDEIEEFGSFLRPHQSSRSIRTLLATTTKTAAHSRCNQTGHSYP